MDNMFKGCKSLLSLDLSSFDTNEMVNSNSAFEGCSSLSSIKMDNFDTSQTTTFMSMFKSCSSLTSLYLPKFNTQKAWEKGLSSIFEGCNGLKISIYSNKCPNLISILPQNIELIDLGNY